MGILVIRTSDGIVAFRDSCPHAQWRLSEGELVNGVLECPGHGWQFDVASGRSLTVLGHSLTSVAVVSANGRIQLEWQ